MVRYCRACDTEFQPHVILCSDCGAELVDRWESEDDDAGETAPEPPPAQPPEPAEPQVVVATDLLSQETARAARRLARAGVKFQVLTHGYTHTIQVPEAEGEAAPNAPAPP